MNKRPTEPQVVVVAAAVVWEVEVEAPQVAPTHLRTLPHPHLRQALR